MLAKRPLVPMVADYAIVLSPRWRDSIRLSCRMVGGALRVHWRASCQFIDPLGVEIEAQIAGEEGGTSDQQAGIAAE